MEKITKDWIDELALKYGKKSKAVRDALWPKAPSKSLTYLNSVQSIGIEKAALIADVLGCSLDELVRRRVPTPSLVNGNNNHVGNVNITNDPESLMQIINAQKQIIDHQNAEIQRITENMNKQLNTKDQQIDRLIKLAQGDGNQ